MERFVFLKIMNNQTQRFPSLVVAAAILCVAFAAAPAYGQTQTPSGADHVSVNLSDPARPAFVKASLVNGGITVKGYDGKEVVVEARARNRESARSDSTMKRIPVSGTGLSVEEENNEVRISTDSFRRAVDLSISVPIHTSLRLSAVNAGDIVVTGVDGELDINDVNGQKPMAFSSLNGDIDVTFPADLKANLSLKSDRGEIFSDFDVQVQASAPQQIVEDGRGHGGKYLVKIDKAVHATINGGGPELQFTNFNGGIYIRKAGAAR